MVLTLVYSETSKQISVPPGGAVQASAEPDRFILVSGAHVAGVSDKLLLQSGAGPVEIPSAVTEGDFILLRDIDDSWGTTPPTVETKNTAHTIGKGQFTPADQSLVLDPGDRDWQNRNQEVLLVFDGTDNWRVVVQGTSVEQVQPTQLINDVQLTFQREHDRALSASTFMWFYDFFKEERGKLEARIAELEQFRTSLTHPTIGALVHNSENIVSNIARITALEGLTQGFTSFGKTILTSDDPIEPGGRYQVFVNAISMPNSDVLTMPEGEGSTVIINMLPESLEITPTAPDVNFNGGTIADGAKAVLPAGKSAELVVMGSPGSDRNWWVKTVF